MLRNLGNVVYDEVTAAKGIEKIEKLISSIIFKESESGKHGRFRRFT